VPGLFNVPAAVETPPSSFAVTYDDALARTSLSGRWRERDAILAFEFLPRLTVSARGAVIDDSLGGFYSRLRDLSANAQFLVARESGWRPAIAVGAIDISGADALYTARYAVATKSWLGRVRTTAGFATGKALHGAFGGITLGVCDWLSLIAEHDGRDATVGARLTPFSATFARAGVVPTLDFLSRRGGQSAVHVGLRVALPGSRLTATSDDHAGVPNRRSVSALVAPSPADGERSVNAVSRALVDEGLENVRVALAGATAGAVISITYENRRYWWDEWEALGAVMAAIARHAPADAIRADITTLRLDMPVMRITTDVSAIRGFLNGSLETAAFARRLDVSGNGAGGAPLTGPAANSSRWRLDLTVKPQIETQLMTEVSVTEERINVLPEATLQLGRGITITARKAVPVYTTDKFFTTIADPNADRLLASIARPLAGVAGLNGFTQVSVGRFGHREVGVSDEMDVVIAGGRASVGGMFAVFGETFGQMDRSVALGTFRWRDAPLGLTATVTAGRYLNGDVGGGVALQRLFGPVEIAFSMASTDFQSVARMRVAVPLGPPHDARPGPVRLRWPGYYDQEIQSTIFADYPVLRRDVALPLETGNELWRVVRQRDRLVTPMLLAHLDDVRAAAARW
jgi:hypothetical protein